MTVAATVTDKGSHSQRGTSATAPGADPHTSSARARDIAHPLLRPFPLTVMALATFLVVFALMMARPSAGIAPTPRSSVAVASVAEGSGTGVVKTATSGAVTRSASAVQLTPAKGPSATTAAVLTRASGAAGARGVGDD